MPQPSPYWGSEAIWTSKNNVHNPMFDERGRVWITSAVRPAANPAYCREGSSHPSAKLFPIANAGRHLAMYDPRTRQLTHISTCFGTHHLMFAEDANHTLWTSGGGPGGRLAQSEDVRGDRRRGEVTGVDGAHSRYERQRPARRVRGAERAGRPREGSSLRRCVLLRRSRTRWIGVGIVSGFPWRRDPAEPGIESARDRACRGVRASDDEPEHAGRGLLAARHGCRSERRGLDRPCERSHGELRSTQMQGAAEWADGHRAALP